VLFSLSPISGYRFLIWGYVACAIMMMILFCFLSPSIEINATTDSQAGLRYVKHRKKIYRIFPVIGMGL
jgi:hypothetical protein